MRRFARIPQHATSPRARVLRARLAIAALLLTILPFGACRSRLPVDHVPRPTGAEPSVPSAPDVETPAATPEPAPALTPALTPASPGTSNGPALHVEYYQISDG